METPGAELLSVTAPLYYPGSGAEPASDTNNDVLAPAASVMLDRDIHRRAAADTPGTTATANVTAAEPRLATVTDIELESATPGFG